LWTEETHPDLLDPPIDATAPKSASTGAVRESIKCKASSSIRPPGGKLLKDSFLLEYLFDFVVSVVFWFFVGFGFGHSGNSSIAYHS
jgi:hypothetical protein